MSLQVSDVHVPAMNFERALLKFPLGRGERRYSQPILFRIRTNFI